MRFTVGRHGKPALVDQDIGLRFNLSHCSTLAALSAPEQVPAFFRCWTRKEAFINALGLGLSFPLDGFEVNLSESSSAQLLLSCAVPDVTDRWRVVGLETEPGWAAAVAATAGDWRVVRWDASVNSR